MSVFNAFMFGVIDIIFLTVVVFLFGASIWYGIRIDIGKGRMYFELYPLRRFFNKDKEDMEQEDRE